MKLLVIVIVNCLQICIFLPLQKIYQQDYIDIVRELLAEGFTAVKFFEKIDFTYAMKADAEEALRQSLACLSTENDNADNLAQSLLAVLDVHLNARRTQDFWTSLRIQEEKDRTRINEELLVEKKKQKSIHIRSNVIDEHLRASDELTIEFIRKTSKYDEANVTGYGMPEQHMPSDDEENESSQYSISRKSKRARTS
ncbi:10440_t:CDS:2 [Paraglomus brasilianum]|uniref:10440_t:CDS:1 n=1 Tax=Paraglomus brasilianum TaxID=144538 RepID=A0A9N9CQK9_9GLOM|nr:10440_t:CDS:2 [Paraglomus brasilianum]